MSDEQTISIPFDDARAAVIRSAAISCGIPVEDFVLDAAVKRAAKIWQDAIEGTSGMKF